MNEGTWTLLFVPGAILLAFATAELLSTIANFIKKKRNQ